MKFSAFLDQRAGLIAVETGHQNVAKNQRRLVVVHFGQCVKAVIGQNDLITRLAQENFRRTTNCAAVVDHHDLEAGVIRVLS